MRFDGLNLNLLGALDALIELKSVTLAAQRMHVSQSAMSAALAQLREYFNDPLCVAIGRRLVLTAKAESLAAPVHDILMRVRATVQSAQAFNPALVSREFKIMASDYVSSAVLSDAVREVARLAPGVTFQLMSVDEHAQESLAKGDIDLLIVPAAFTAEQHPQAVLFEDDYACIAWSGNRAVAEGLSIAQYAELGHVATRFGTSRTPSFEDWYIRHHGYRRRIEVTADTFHLVPQLIIGTNRIATVPSRLARRYAAFLPIALFTPPFAIPPLVEVIQWHTCQDMDAGNIWLRQLLLAAGQVTPEA
ncbi:MAG: LysR family transcriptional regulator [Pseudomonadota bacterium]